MTRRISLISQTLNRSLATPLTIASSIAVFTSGVMLFFHWGEKHVEDLHEWMGMALVIFTVWHSMVNWRPLKKHLKSHTVWLFFILTLVFSSAFVYSSSQAEQDIETILIRRIESAPLRTVAAVLSLSERELISRARQQNIQIDNLDQSIIEIARSTRTHPQEIWTLLLSGLSQ
jgi:hypothetical protein